MRLLYGPIIECLNECLVSGQTADWMTACLIEWPYHRLNYWFTVWLYFNEWLPDWLHELTDWLITWTHCLTDYMNSLTDWLHELTDWLITWTHWLTDYMNSLTDWLVHRRFVDWMTDWLIEWLQQLYVRFVDQLFVEKMNTLLIELPIHWFWTTDCLMGRLILSQWPPDRPTEGLVNWMTGVPNDYKWLLIPQTIKAHFMV
jgi:hypothetical protein